MNVCISVSERVRKKNCKFHLKLSVSDAFFEAMGDYFFLCFKGGSVSTLQQQSFNSFAAHFLKTILDINLKLAVSFFCIEYDLQS